MHGLGPNAMALPTLGDSTQLVFIRCIDKYATNFKAIRIGMSNFSPEILAENQRHNIRRSHSSFLDYLQKVKSKPV